MKFIIRALMLGALLSFNSIAQEVMLDRVAVIVDQGVVLESEIEALVQEVKETPRRMASSSPLIAHFAHRPLNDSLQKAFSFKWLNAWVFKSVTLN